MSNARQPCLFRRTTIVVNNNKPTYRFKGFKKTTLVLASYYFYNRSTLNTSLRILCNFSLRAIEPPRASNVNADWRVICAECLNNDQAGKYLFSQPHDDYAASISFKAYNAIHVYRGGATGF